MTTGVSPTRAWRVTISLAFRAWPFGAVGRVAVVVVSQACRGVLPGLALRRVIQGGGAGWMAVLASAALVPTATSPLWEYFQRGLISRTNQAVTAAVMAAAVSPPGIEHLESQQYADALEAVRTNTRAPGLLFDWIATIAGAAFGVVASVFILARVHLLLVLPVLGAVALGRLHAATRRCAIAYHDESIPGQRLARRLVELGTSPRPAKEVRVLGMGPWLVERHLAITDSVARLLVQGERGPVLAAAASGVVQAGLLSLGVVWLVHLATTGRASAGDLALGLVLLGSAVDDASGLGSAVGSDLVTNTHAAQRYLWLLDYVPRVVRSIDPQPVPAQLRSGIELRNVRFSYPGGYGSRHHRRHPHPASGHYRRLGRGQRGREVDARQAALPFLRPRCRSRDRGRRRSTGSRSRRVEGGVHGRVPGLHALQVPRPRSGRCRRHRVDRRSWACGRGGPLRRVRPLPRAPCRRVRDPVGAGPSRWG